MRRVIVSGCALLALAGAPLSSAMETENVEEIDAGSLKEQVSARANGEHSEPVAIPETLGATLLAGAGFLFMLRRRRFA